MSYWLFIVFTVFWLEVAVCAFMTGYCLGQSAAFRKAREILRDWKP